MLGTQIDDPLGLEGPPGSAEGLGLLDFTTTLHASKRLAQVTGHLTLDQAPVQGYEIHAGVSAGPALDSPLVKLEGGRLDGARSADQLIAGTYLHGLFESPDANRALLQWAGLDAPVIQDYAALRARDIDRLADLVQHHLDTERLDALLGIRP